MTVGQQLLVIFIFLGARGIDGAHGRDGHSGSSGVGYGGNGGRGGDGTPGQNGTDGARGQDATPIDNTFVSHTDFKDDGEIVVELLGIPPTGQYVVFLQILVHVVKSGSFRIGL